MRAWRSVVLALALLFIPESAIAQSEDETSKLSAEAKRLADAGKFLEAIDPAKKAVDLTQRKFGPDHLKVATRLNNLGILYKNLGRVAEAELAFERALSIRENAPNPNSHLVLESLNNLAKTYQDHGRYTDAETLFKRVLVYYEGWSKPKPHDVIKGLNNLADLYRAQGRYADADALYKRALSIHEKGQPRAYPSEEALIQDTLHNLAGLYQAQGRYSDAEAPRKRALTIDETAFGPNDPRVANSLTKLALLYQIQGRYTDAESLYKRSLSIRETAHGPNHPAVAVNLNNLATLYHIQRRYADAERLFKRSLSVRETAFGANHPEVGNSLNNLAAMYREQGLNVEAEPLMTRALAIREKALGPHHPDVANSLNNLANIYQQLGRSADAEPLYRRALSIAETSIGPNPTYLTAPLTNLARLCSRQGRYVEAEPLLKRALATHEKLLGPDHPFVAKSLNALGLLYFVQGNWSFAVNYLRRGTDLIAKRTRHATEVVGGSFIDHSKNEASHATGDFGSLVKAAYRQAMTEGGIGNKLAREMFATAQWSASSDASAAMARMSARQERGDTELAKLVRERQDLVGEWQRRDQQRLTAISQAPEERERNVEDANLTQLATVDKRIAEIDEVLAAKFPDYTVLANPEPLDVSEVQSQLGENEALVLFLDTPKSDPTPEETFIWVVTKTDMRWLRSDLGRESLANEVQALRCGLDKAGWAKEKICNTLAVQRASGTSLLFDLARSHRVYKALFDAAEDLIKGKALLIVPSGALTQLPFQVLVTSPPAGPDYRSAAWLIRDHAVTVLPAVSSLKALRRVSHPSGAHKPLIGFGNPLLNGPDQSYAPFARLARVKQSCRASGSELMGYFGFPDGVTPIDMRRGLADVSLIRKQMPLPETADELCAVAREVDANASEIRLGARATESEIKALSESGALADYRIVHFATHGAMAGELSADSEPGLILTPPNQASDADDGYLTASEIAALKLDADWVILSACNTAAGNTDNAEALSGIASAFIYAQARALLVSHWAVNSDAAVKLTTRAIKEIGQDQSVGRAEALRRAMLSLIDSGDQHETHPAYWAPFVVIGEGTR